MNEAQTAKLEQFIDLLDGYIDGQINNTDKIELSIKEDPFLNEVLKQHVQARANMRVIGEEELRKKIGASFDPILEKAKPKTSIWKIIILVLLLAAVAIAIYYSTQG